MVSQEEKIITEKIDPTVHAPVLLKEVIESLNIKKGDVVFDGTLGGGGYSEKICEIISPDGVLVATDQDADAIKRSEEKLKRFDCKKILVNNNFRNIDKVLADAGIEKINAFVLDLGLSSDQFELSGRGFSFQKNEPLLMTFQKDSVKSNFTAKEIVNEWDEQNIADILFGYGDERFSRRIAKKIVEARKEKNIDTTFDLVEIIKQAVPVWYRNGKTHFATKTFQALRIAVNDEIGSLRDGLKKGFEALEDGGRMVVVSFHSTEDRVVKNFMRDLKKEDKGILVYKKPLSPSKEETKSNPRARSAKLRVFEKNK